MKIKIELKHESLGVCDTKIALGETGKKKIISNWKKKYGKTMDKCTIVSIIVSYSKSGPKGRPFIEKKTGERYESLGAGSRELKINPGTISYHCKRESNPAFENKFRWA